MRIFFVFIAFLLPNLSLAAVPIDGWYASVFGGYAYVPENVSKTTDGFLRNDASYDNGWNGGGRIGYQSMPLRYEIEGTYIFSNLKRFKLNHVRQHNTDGQSTATLLMANVYYDFPDIVPYIAPFLGVGIGYGYLTARLNSSDLTVPNDPSFNSQLHIDDSVFAFQGTAGLTYNFSEDYSVNIAYRYVDTGSAGDFNKHYQAHLATAGVVFRFDGATYK